MQERVEYRDGKPFKVTVLPEAKPPKNRNQRTRFHLPPGDVGGRGKQKKRRKKKPG